MSSENAELEAKHQKYKGRVVLRGDIVKDDFVSYAVSTEKGSSASQRTAAKVMDFISRMPGYWECFFVHREKGVLLFVYVDDIKFNNSTKYLLHVSMTITLKQKS